MKRKISAGKSRAAQRRPSARVRNAVIPIAVKGKAAKRRAANDDNLAVIPVAVTDGDKAASGQAAAIRGAQHEATDLALIPIAVNDAPQAGARSGRAMQAGSAGGGRKSAMRRRTAAGGRSKQPRDSHAAKSRRSHASSSKLIVMSAKPKSHQPEGALQPALQSKVVAEVTDAAKDAVDMIAQYGYLAIDAWEDLFGLLRGKPVARRGATRREFLPAAMVREELNAINTTIESRVA